jgi:hypothetical protein
MNAGDQSDMSARSLLLRGNEGARPGPEDVSVHAKAWYQVQNALNERLATRFLATGEQAKAVLLEASAEVRKDSWAILRDTMRSGISLGMILEAEAWRPSW